MHALSSPRDGPRLLDEGVSDCCFPLLSFFFSPLFQLREEFDQGFDVFLDDSQCVHDVAALLKEFFRNMPDSLIPRELYPAFVSTACK